MYKILHIATDEKFINAADYLYEKAFPKQNIFFIITPNKKEYQLKYIKAKSNFSFFRQNSKTFNKISNIIKNYDLVILHGYDLFKAKLVNNNPKEKYVYVSIQ